MRKLPLKHKSIPPIYLYLAALLVLVISKLVEESDPFLHQLLLFLGGFLLFIAILRFFRR